MSKLKKVRIKQLNDELWRLKNEQERLQIELNRVNEEKKMIEKQIKEEKKPREKGTELEEKIYQSTSNIVSLIKRTTSRDDRDRLILSIERMDFSEDFLAGWTEAMFVTRKCLIRLKNEENEFTERMTPVQLKILAKNSCFDQKWIRRSDLSAETGKWEYLGPADHLISCGGEAIVLKTESVQYSSKKSMAVRVQAFDPNFFVGDFDLDSFLVEINIFSDFANAVAPTRTEALRNGKKPPKDSRPCYKNVLKHYYNIRFFDKIDDEKQDCFGWITFMDFIPYSLREFLKNDSLNLLERKLILREVYQGLNYLEDIGLQHYDLKPENILLDENLTPKIIDYGLVEDSSGNMGYRKMGYCRDGSMFRAHNHLYAGSPAFSCGQQLLERGEFRNRNIFVFLACDWKSAWTLLYKPLEDNGERFSVNERFRIKKILQESGASWIRNSFPTLEDIDGLQKTVTLINCSSTFCLDDPNLTKSLVAASMKGRLTRKFNFDFKNVTKNAIDQKDSDLCVPITVATLVKHAMVHDLNVDQSKYPIERILTHITMEIYHRSMAGLDLNPNEAEKDFQENDIETLLKRLVFPTYLNPSGWDIIREWELPKTSCSFQKVRLNQNFKFTRPLTVTGAYFSPETGVFFHQMVLDYIDEQSNEYVLQNTLLSEWNSSLKIKVDQPYYVSETNIREYLDLYGKYEFHDNGVFMRLANEKVGQTMDPYKWYLLPQAYKITLTKIE